MTVYDRVIPNAAIESLIALTVGVVIALGFDFLIHYIRALFIYHRFLPICQFGWPYLKNFCGCSKDIKI